MLGKTHMAVGVAASLIVTNPTTITELILGSGIGIVGSVISDIDVGTSESHREADKIIAIVTCIMIAIGVLDFFGGLGIWDRIKQNGVLYPKVIAVLVFVGICAYGREQPHRSFMHSFLALGLLSVTMLFIYEPMVKYFVIGFISHIALDIFNYKKVRLLYPAKKGVCFKLAHSNGLVNDAAFITAVIVSGLKVIAVSWGEIAACLQPLL